MPRRSSREDQIFGILEDTLSDIQKLLHELEFKLAANTIETKYIKRDVKSLTTKVDTLHSSLQQTAKIAPWYASPRNLTIILIIILIFMMIMARVAGVTVPEGLI